MERKNNLGFFSLTAVLSGLLVCIPAIMAGHILYTSYGFMGFWIGLVFGSIFLFLGGCLFTRLTLIHRKILIDIVDEYFGKRGARFAGLGFGVSLLGWFAIQLEVKAQGILSLYPMIPQIPLIIGMGILMTIHVIKGMGAISRFAGITMPFIVLMMGLALYGSYDSSVGPSNLNLSFSGIGFVIACNFAGVIDLPTYFVHTKSGKDAYIANALVFLVILPFMAIVGGALAFYKGGDDFITTIISLGGQMWQWFCFIFILLAGWTTNNGNLYSATLALQPCLGQSYSFRTACLGAIGTCIGCLGVLQNFENTLSAMGIILASLGGGMVARLICDRFSYQPLSEVEQKLYLSIMIVGTIFGISSHLSLFAFTGFGFIDSFIFVLGASLLLERTVYGLYRLKQS